MLLFRMDSMETDEIREGSKKRKRGSSEGDEWYPQIGIIWDGTLFAEMKKVAQISRRALMTHSLISAYDLLRNMTLLKPIPTTDWDLSGFHSSDFIEYMKSINCSEKFDEEKVELKHGLGYDCPPLAGIFDFICSVAGATLTACRALVDEKVDVAINWSGGWHHAQRDKAEGFCYVNDVALAILEMLPKFSEILYIDLDVHHCNGVEACFEWSNKVVTLSLHQYEPGFYPGSGSISNIGCGSGKYYTVNVPLREGITDEPYFRVFKSVLDSVLKHFSASAIVVQCGGDCLAGDPLGSFNLSPEGIAACLLQVLNIRKPTLVLGGGGYNIVNTSKLWTFLTSVIIGCDLPSDIPDHIYFTSYGPDFILDVTPNNRKDLNTPEYLNSIISAVAENCSKMGSGCT